MYIFAKLIISCIKPVYMRTVYSSLSTLSFGIIANTFTKLQPHFNTIYIGRIFENRHRLTIFNIWIMLAHSQTLLVSDSLDSKTCPSTQLWPMQLLQLLLLLLCNNNSKIGDCVNDFCHVRPSIILKHHNSLQNTHVVYCTIQRCNIMSEQLNIFGFNFVSGQRIYYFYSRHSLYYGLNMHIAQNVKYSYLRQISTTLFLSYAVKHSFFISVYFI